MGIAIYFQKIANSLESSLLQILSEFYQRYASDYGEYLDKIVLYLHRPVHTSYSSVF